MATRFGWPDIKPLCSLLGMRGQRTEAPVVIGRASALVNMCRHLQFLDNEEQRAKITDPTLPKERRYMHRHRTIAAHYRFIFHQMFDCLGFPKVIILEVRHKLIL